jgi:phosphatidylglycerophosphate synthase
MPLATRSRRALSSFSRSKKARQGTEVVCEHVFRPLAHPFVLLFARLRVPPPAVVLLAAATGIGGAVELGRGHVVVAASLVQLKTVLDNADGQLARLTGRITDLGRYLDSECDLLVNAALFGAVGLRYGVVGFVLLTAVLSVNFNAERIWRGGVASWDSSPLGRAYGLLYGWQDRIADRVFGARGIQTWQVGVLANLGMSTQLAAFGLCMVLGHASVFTWLLAVEAVAVVVVLCIPPRQEVSLEHR